MISTPVITSSFSPLPLPALFCLSSEKNENLNSLLFKNNEDKSMGYASMVRNTCFCTEPGLGS